MDTEHIYINADWRWSQTGSHEITLGHRSERVRKADTKAGPAGETVVAWEQTYFPTLAQALTAAANRDMAAAKSMGDIVQRITEFHGDIERMTAMGE